MSVLTAPAPAPHVTALMADGTGIDAPVVDIGVARRRIVELETELEYVLADLLDARALVGQLQADLTDVHGERLALEDDLRAAELRNRHLVDDLHSALSTIADALTEQPTHTGATAADPDGDRS